MVRLDCTAKPRSIGPCHIRAHAVLQLNPLECFTWLTLQSVFPQSLFEQACVFPPALGLKSAHCTRVNTMFSDALCSTQFVLQTTPEALNELMMDIQRSSLNLQHSTSAKTPEASARKASCQAIQKARGLESDVARAQSVICHPSQHVIDEHRFAPVSSDEPSKESSGDGAYDSKSNSHRARRGSHFTEESFRYSLPSSHEQPAHQAGRFSISGWAKEVNAVCTRLLFQSIDAIL